MTWNYRVISRLDSDGVPDRFGIHEVYYDSSGRIEMWSEEPCDPFGESLTELTKDIEMMSEALSEPVLLETELLAELATRPDGSQIDPNGDEEDTKASDS